MDLNTQPGPMGPSAGIQQEGWCYSCARAHRTVMCSHFVHHIWDLLTPANGQTSPNARAPQRRSFFRSTWGSGSAKLPKYTRLDVPRRACARRGATSASERQQRVFTAVSPRKRHAHTRTTHAQSAAGPQSRPALRRPPPHSGAAAAPHAALLTSPAPRTADTRPWNACRLSWPCLAPVSRSFSPSSAPKMRLRCWSRVWSRGPPSSYAASGGSDAGAEAPSDGGAEQKDGAAGWVSSPWVSLSCLTAAASLSRPAEGTPKVTSCCDFHNKTPQKLFL